MKLLTHRGARLLGQGHTFSTTVVAGATPRQVVLVGEGTRCSRAPRAATTPTRPGPTCSPWRRRPPALDGLGRTRVSLGYDASLFTGPRQPAVAGVVPARRRGLADLGAVGRRGPGASGDGGPVGRPRPRCGPGARAGTRQAGDRGRGPFRPLTTRTPSPTLAEVESAPARAGRAVGARDERQRGRRGAVPARRARHGPARVVRRGERRRTRRPRRTSDRDRRSADPGRQRALPRRPGRGGDRPRGGRRGRGRGPPRAAPGRGRPPRRGLHRLADLPVRHRRRRRPGPTGRRPAR